MVSLRADHDEDSGMALRFLLSGAVAMFLFMVFLGTGTAALRIMRLGSRRGAFWLIARIGIGFALFGNLIMVLCFLHCAHSRIIITTLAVGFLISLPFLKQPLYEAAGFARSFSGVVKRYPVLSGACFVMLTGYLVIGLFPPSDFDALMYHLATAKLYLKQGGFWNIFFNAQSDYPMLTEMVYMAGMALGNDSICKAVSFGISILLVGAIACITKQYLHAGSRELLLSVLVFCTSTSVIAGFTACNVDMAQALWTLLAVRALEQYLEERHGGILILTALFAGMALQTKIFGVFVLPILVVRMIISDYAERSAQKQSLAFKGKTIARVVTPYLIIIATAVAMGLPWYLKALFYKGTILSVYHSSIEGQGLATPMNFQAASPLMQAIVNTVVRIIAAPWTFSLFPGQHQGDTFGPLFIALLPFLLVTGVPRKARFLLLAAGIYWAMILILEMTFVQGGSSIRYSTLIIAIGAAFIPWVVAHLSFRPLLHRAALLMMLSMIFLGMILFLKRNHREWIALCKNQTRDAYYGAVLKEYPIIRRINSLTDGKTVMPIYNYDDYLIDVPFITAYRTYRNVGEMRADMIAKNIGYIFANNKLDTAENSRAYPGLVEKTCIASENGFYLYRLDFGDSRR
jgi:hypothetical protein